MPRYGVRLQFPGATNCTGVSYLFGLIDPANLGPSIDPGIALGFSSQPGQTVIIPRAKCLLACGRSSGQPKTDIVVPVISVVPVATSDPTIVIIIVPRAASQHGGSGNTHPKDQFF